jgi:hypothetical protein
MKVSNVMSKLGFQANSVGLLLINVKIMPGNIVEKMPGNIGMIELLTFFYVPLN